MQILKTKLILILGIIITITSCNQWTDKPDLALKYVDPNIGGVGVMLQPTRPTVQLPNEMIRMYPVRADYLDDRISYFPLSIISHRLGEIFGIMPFIGSFGKAPLSKWDQQLEKSTPYYYSVFLEDYNITLEFSPGKKSGFFQVTYLEHNLQKLYLKNVNNGNWKMVSPTIYKGEENFNGMKAFVYAEFNKAGTFDSENNTISWPEATGNILEFKYAISYISLEQAKENLLSEIPDWDFNKLKSNAERLWAKTLNQIEVEGGTEARKRTFYTALYRCYERMVDITENGKYYSNYDKKIHADNNAFFVDDWTWDTFLALHPLRSILNPVKEADMIESYVRIYNQSGWLPTFPVLWGDHACMNGFHSTIMILDAYRKGIRNFDYNKAYEAMKKNALQATMLPWRNGVMCSLDTFYKENGFFPALKPGEKETVALVHPFERRQAVAITLGHSYDDWALAQMAKELGKSDDYNYFIKRSKNYTNLFWKEKGFFMPKDKDGQWIDIDPKFDGGPGGRDYYDENNGWTYLWQVQHDIPGLIELMGGKEKFESRLDQFFNEKIGMSKSDFWAKFPDASALIGQYSMGNEPSFFIPYLYTQTNSPWKTQKQIRMLLNTWFPDNLFGIPGDEDGGGMSAFVVFSCMGFYPMVPGLPEYTIGSPVFTKVTIHLPNGKTFRMMAPECNETNKYIQKAWFNGKPITKLSFTHEELMQGGELKLEMGPNPNKKLGVENYN